MGFRTGSATCRGFWRLLQWLSSPSHPSPWCRAALCPHPSSASSLQLGVTCSSSACDISSSFSAAYYEYPELMLLNAAHSGSQSTVCTIKLASSGIFWVLVLPPQCYLLIAQRKYSRTLLVPLSYIHVYFHNSLIQYLSLPDLVCQKEREKEEKHMRDLDCLTSAFL